MTGEWHEHEWVESDPGTGLGEPVAFCRCGIYRTDAAPGISFECGGARPDRSAFEMFQARHGTAATAQANAEATKPAKDQAAASCPCCACSPGLERADHCPATCDCWAEQPITNGPSSLTERDDSGPSVMPADLHAKTT